MNNDVQNPPLGYFPLYGATFDSEDVGLLGGRALIYVPDTAEWRSIEKRDVSDEVGLNIWKEFVGVPAPLCVVIGAPIVAEGSKGEWTDQQIARTSREGDDAVLALRLYRPGFFIDPEMTMRVFRHTNGFNIRIAGAYRQTAIEGPSEPAMPAYHLKLADLTTGEEPSHLTQLWSLVRRYRARGRRAAEIPIDSFRFSYGYSLPATARAAFLFIALDAMLGGMSARRIDDFRLRARFVDRVRSALILGGHRDKAAATEALWLDNEGRRIRNSIAHGRPSEVAADARRADARLRSTVRSILKAYLVHCVERGSLPRGPADQPVDRSSAVVSFNRMLES